MQLPHDTRLVIGKMKLEEVRIRVPNRQKSEDFIELFCCSCLSDEKAQVLSLTSKKKELEENFRAVGFAALVAGLARRASVTEPWSRMKMPRKRMHIVHNWPVSTLPSPPHITC